MKPVHTLVLSTLLSALLAAPASAKEKKSTGSTKTSSGKSSAGKHSQWMERSDPKGFTLKAPADATEKRDEWSTIYVATLPPDALLKATVTVETLDEFTAVTNLEKAVEAVLAARPRGMQAAISEQKEIPKGYLIIIGPEYDTYAVTAFRNGKEVQVKAHCTGPSSRLDEIKELCLSMKPTK